MTATKHSCKVSPGKNSVPLTIETNNISVILQTFHHCDGFIEASESCPIVIYKGTRLTHNRTFRGPSERRDPGSVQLRHEQRPKQQTQLSLRGPYTEEAPSQPIQDELYRMDHSGVMLDPTLRFHTRMLKTTAVRTEYPKAELS